MLVGPLAKNGYDWWWHSFTGIDEEGKETQFFVEFFIINPALGKDEPVFGQLKENKEKGIRPSYLMVKAGCWGENKCQLHRFFGINKVRIKEGIYFEVEADDCFASETALRGSISLTPEEVEAHPEYMCDAGDIKFDLKVEKKIAFDIGYGAGTEFRAAEAFEMYWHGEGIKSLFEGTVILNGKKYTVSKDTSYGYADKNWGNNFTSPWIWISSCKMKSNLTGEVLEDSAFDVGGGSPKIFNYALDKKLLGGLTLRGKDYEFNFAKLLTQCRTDYEVNETDEKLIIDVDMTTRSNKLVVHVECLKKDMIFINYESPDGKKRHNRLWNGATGSGNLKIYAIKKKQISLIDDVEIRNVGCEYGDYDK